MYATSQGLQVSESNTSPLLAGHRRRTAPAFIPTDYATRSVIHLDIIASHTPSISLVVRNMGEIHYKIENIIFVLGLGIIALSLVIGFYF